MFRNVDNFKRESSSRHRSEKLLDKNLYRFHKKTVTARVKKLKELGVKATLD